MEGTVTATDVFETRRDPMRSLGEANSSGVAGGRLSVAPRRRSALPDSAGARGGI